MSSNPLSFGSRSDTDQRSLVDSLAVDSDTVEWKSIVLVEPPVAAFRKLQEALSQGANVASMTTKGKTALHIAARHGRTQIAESLIKHGADVNAVRKSPPELYASRPDKRTWRWRPIHYAARNGNGDMIQVLINGGAGINELSECGETALDVAMTERQEVAFWVLVQNHAVSTIIPDLDKDNLPGWILDKIEKTREPRFLIAHLEEKLQQTLHTVERERSWKLQKYCSRCRENWSNARWTAVENLRGPGKTFNYGFSTRCQLCSVTRPRTLAIPRSVWERTPASTRCGLVEGRFLMIMKKTAANNCRRRPGEHFCRVLLARE